MRVRAGEVQPIAPTLVELLRRQAEPYRDKAHTPTSYAESDRKVRAIAAARIRWQRERR